MPLQLDLFGNWVEVAAASAPPPPVAPPVEAVVPPLPGQVGLLDGPHLGATAAVETLLALDPAAVRTVAAEVTDRYPALKAPALWCRWAAALDGLLALDPAHLGARARALRTRSAREVAFPGLDAARGAQLLIALERHAAAAQIADVGPAAEMADGQLAARWLAATGDLPGAAQALEAALEADPTAVKVQRVWAETLTALGRLPEAAVAWRDALLLEPAQVDEAALTEGPLAAALDAVDESELPGEARDWVPAMADLQGLLRLPWWAEHAAGADAAGAFTRALRQYRRAQEAAAPEAQMLEAKRALVRLAPQLRDRIRHI